MARQTAIEDKILVEEIEEKTVGSGIKINSDVSFLASLTFGDAVLDTMILNGRFATSSLAGAALDIGATYAYSELMEIRADVSNWTLVGGSFAGMYMRTSASLGGAKNLHGIQIVSAMNTSTTSGLSLVMPGYFEMLVKASASNRTLTDARAVEANLSLENQTGTLTLTNDIHCLLAKAQTGTGLADYTKICGIKICGRDDGTARVFGKALDISNPEATVCSWTTAINISTTCTTGIDVSAATTEAINITGNSTRAINIDTGTFGTGISIGTCSTTCIDITATTGRGLRIGTKGKSSDGSLPITATLPFDTEPANNYLLGVFTKVATDAAAATDDLGSAWLRTRLNAAMTTNAGYSLYGSKSQLRIYGGTTTTVSNWAAAGMLGVLEVSGASTTFASGSISAAVYANVSLTTDATIASGAVVAAIVASSNASGVTDTGNAYYGIYVGGTGARAFDTGIYVKPTAASKILVAGTGSGANAITDDTASVKFMQVYCDCGATSGTSVGFYIREYLTGTGGSNAVIRGYSDVVGVAASTAQGCQISLGFGESTTTGSVTGLGVGGRFQIGLADVAYPGTGTLAVIQSEIYSFGASADPSGNNIAMFRVVNDGHQDGKDDVDDDAVLFSFAGWTSGSAHLYTKAASPTTTPSAAYSIKCKMPDGVIAYLYLGTSAVTP
jgi:hypothetical protein